MSEEAHKLEKELQFLKESLDNQIISEEEYAAGKERIEKKLATVEDKKEQPKEEIVIRKVEDQPEKPSPEEEKPEEKQEPPQEEPKEAIKQDQEPIKEETKKEPEPVKEETKQEPSKEEIKKESEIKEEPKQEEKPVVAEPLNSEKQPKVWKWVLGTIILVIILFYFFRIDTAESETVAEKIEDLTLACSQDRDCQQEGKLGFCNNPGEQGAACNSQEDVLVKVTILNDASCSICDTARMKSVLQQIFPNIAYTTVDVASPEGKQLVGKPHLTTFPAYFIEKDAEAAHNFQSFASALIDIDEFYVMNTRSSGAGYYFSRPEQKGEFVLFIKKGEAASQQAESNLQETITAFGDSMTFSIADETDPRVKELDITTFPIVFINNKYKYGGVRAADDYKTIFCEYNEAEACSLTLSKELII